MWRESVAQAQRDAGYAYAVKTHAELGNQGIKLLMTGQERASMFRTVEPFDEGVRYYLYKVRTEE